MKVGILYICTGRYDMFWKEFYESCENNFLPNCEKEYYVFTDSKSEEFKMHPNVNVFYKEKLPWPLPAILRYQYFLSVDYNLDVEYLFFFNANMRIEGAVSKEEFLPTKENFVALSHPSLYNKKPQEFTYEPRVDSTAYIDKDKGEHYFMSSLMGGKVKPFLDACRVMDKNIQIDLYKNIIALWHDESHWNRYLLGRSDVKILSPSYGYPQEMTLPFECKIMLRDKHLHGGHKFLRGRL